MIAIYTYLKVQEEEQSEMEFKLDKAKQNMSWGIHQSFEESLIEWTITQPQKRTSSVEPIPAQKNYRLEEEYLVSRILFSIHHENRIE